MDPILLPFVGFLVGILIGLTGVGGGATLAPVLLIFFQLELIAVVAIDLVFSCITKSIGIIFHFILVIPDVNVHLRQNYNDSY